MCIPQSARRKRCDRFGHNLLPALVLCVLPLLHESVCQASEPALPQPASAAQTERFESQVRPLLVQHCLECHGEKKQEAGLRLDSSEAAGRGGDNGPVIAPGKPDESRLITAIRYDGDIQMPPDGKLTDEQIQALVNWIQDGAHWPASSTPAPSADKARLAETHWAFQPILPQQPPQVSQADWCANPIDSFVVARLEKAGLAPSAPADRWTLLRRATFDLTGLPPTYDEVQAFLNDTSPDAFSKVVDRLLASPQYGPRWARHWLDVARYADTRGYVFTQDPRYPFAYTYRDYVVRAFNEDLPYDRFIREQLAADQLPHDDDPRRLAAMGFLTLGRRFSNNIHDIIDDRIDVVTRGLLGLTVTCARCHDHKYDPIPSADYYSLYGVFASSVEPEDLPIICPINENEAYVAHQKQREEQSRALDAFVNEQQQKIARELREHLADYLVHVAGTAPEVPRGDEPMVSLNPGEIKPLVARRWRGYLERAERDKNPVWTLWHRLAPLKAEDFAEQAGQILANWDASVPLNPRVKEAFAAEPPTSMADVAKRYAQLLAKADQQWQDALAAATTTTGAGATPMPPTALPDAADEELRQVLYAERTPLSVRTKDLDELLDRAASNKLSMMRQTLGELDATSPDAPPRAMVLNDSPTPHQPRIFVRGNPARQGDEVPRQFLAALSPADRHPFQQGSGRLELAEAIANSANPLTARVMVNRIWLHHFGAGLVTTPSDFGVRGEPPTNPELLDWLAGAFQANGWSIKALHRLIMLSSTYQQSSHDRAECAQVDPENRLLWKMNRRRIEFEALRDSLLAVAGRLDTQLDGRAVELFTEPFSTRRTIYGKIDRQDLPGVLRVFDFASPDVSTPQRPVTSVPQQALFVMNSPFVAEQARYLTARAEIAGEVDSGKRVQALYRAVFARDADTREIELGVNFIAILALAGDATPPAGGSAPRLSAWEQYAQALLLTNEMTFID